MIRKLPPTARILIAMVIGILVGWAVFAQAPDKATASQIAGYFSIVSDIFLRLIKMIIAPLVFSTLVVGIALAFGGASLFKVSATCCVTVLLVELLLCR